MQAVRCLRVLYQCPPKASVFLKCFRPGTPSPTAQSPHKASPGRLYMCTKSILTEKGTSDEPHADLGDPGDNQKAQMDENFDYFKSLVANPSTPKDLEETAIERKLKLKTSNLSELRPSLQTKSGNLASYVNDSQTLTELVQLGVNLSVVEKDQKVANHLLKVDFETGVRPYLKFLLGLNVSVDDLSRVLTKNPTLLMEDMDDMQVRINYLESKKFSNEAITRIITKAPRFLTQPTKITDTQLGALQKLFSLTGDELRQVVTAYPHLTTWPRGMVKDMHFVIHEILGFTNREQKEMLLIQPKVYTSNRKKVELTFDYLHNKMGLSHADICRWPQVFRTRLFIIQQRHKFMKSIGRAQYDPTKENFVALKALVANRDAEFCDNVAKVSVREYNDFLKTL